MEFWNTVLGAEGGAIVAAGDKFQLEQRWKNTTFWDARNPNGSVIQETFLFACAKMRGKTDRLAALKAAANEMAADQREVPPESVKTFVEAVVGVMIAESINPSVKIVKDEKEPPRSGKEFVRLKGLSLLPEPFIQEHIGRKLNAVDAMGKSLHPEEEDEEEVSEDARKAKKRRVFGKGTKDRAQMTNETMSQMAQVAGVSRPVYADGECVLSLLTPQQEKGLLKMFAHAKHLAEATKGKDNVFLEALHQMSAPQDLLEKVRKLFNADSGQDLHKERLYSNAMIVISDMLLRVVAAHNSGTKLDETRVVEMEQAAAVMTRLGTNKLQQTTTKPVAEFCKLFGLAKTEELQRLMLDPKVMEKEQRKELEKTLKEAFKLRSSLGWHKKSGDFANAGRGAKQEEEDEGEQEHCPTFGSKCWDVIAGQPCTHKHGKKWGKGKGRGEGEGEGEVTGTDEGNGSGYGRGQY